MQSRSSDPRGKFDEGWGSPVGFRETTLARFAPLCFAMFCGFTTVAAPLPVLPLRVHEELGLGVTVAGSVGLQSIATLATRSFAGRSVDQNGAKLTLVSGLLTLSCAGMIYIASSAPFLSPVASLLALLVGRVTLGFGESYLITGVLSWAIARAGAGRSGRAMSWNGMAQYGALVAGAPTGLAVYHVAGFGAVSVLTSLLPLLALAAIWRLEAVPPTRGTRLPFLNAVSAIGLPGSALMLSGFGFAALSAFSSLAYAARGWSGAGLSLTGFGVAFITVRLLGGHLPEISGSRPIAIASLAIKCAGQAVMWVAPDPLSSIVGSVLTGAGCALIFHLWASRSCAGSPQSTAESALGLSRPSRI